MLTGLTFDTVMWKATTEAKFFGMYMDVKVVYDGDQPDKAAQTTESVRHLVSKLPEECKQGARASEN